MKAKLLSMLLCATLFGATPRDAHAIDGNTVALVGGITGAGVSAGALYLCYKRAKALEKQLAPGLDEKELALLKKKLWWYRFGMGTSGVAIPACLIAAAIGGYNLMTAKEKEKKLFEKKVIMISLDDEKTVLHRKDGFKIVKGGTNLDYLIEDLDQEIECIKTLQNEGQNRLNAFQRNVTHIKENGLSHTSLQSEAEKDLLLDFIKDNNMFVHFSSGYAKCQTKQYQELTSLETLALGAFYKTARENQIKSTGMFAGIKNLIFTDSLPGPKPKKE